MAENRFQPRVRGEVVEDDVVVFLDGKAFHGWEGVTIEKNIDSIANSFTLDLDERFTVNNEPWIIKNGVEVEIRIGKERVLTGFIEITNPSFDAGSRTFQVSGRSKPGDLVDSSVVGPSEYNNISLDALARELIKPFGLKVFLSVEPKVIDKFAIKPGETIFEALDRAARLQGFFWVSTRAGNIRLTRRARARADSEIHQNVNMLSGSLTDDATKRFQTYNVIGQAGGTDEVFGANASEALGTANDRGVKRARTLTVVAEGSVDTEKAKTRAGWEASIRKAQAFELEVSVEGWTQESGILWGINQLCFVKSPFLGVNREFLISSVRHTISNSESAKTTMTLAPQDAFEAKAEFPEGDDDSGLLGQLKSVKGVTASTGTTETSSKEGDNAT